MRQKRAKTYRKLMTLYSMSFGFRQPYQVLVDSQICKEATEHKLDLLKQLGSVLQGNIKPMITQCCIHELYLQKSQQPAVDLAKTFERRKCNHREIIPGDDCLTSVVGDSNKHRYVIATQSQPLRSNLRAIPAVPLVHLNRSVMVLEPPSDATIAAKQEVEEKALHASHPVPDTAARPSEPPPKKKTGPKGPNPLSVKKKKKAEDSASKKGPQQKSDDTAVRVGGKRKRTDDEEVHDENSGGPTKKRKRKRRAKNSDSASVSRTSVALS
ncbi:hypothetical protein E1B28_001247 [Marasmius oreades]|uniref:U three protein 23 n=1 Tax=Marasmius oreades TaxID=181124 RepID=A0A9P7V349_9AGAR|nr:uncharacterized protein E1B28_001247 [Marasmius oreades]KAG7099394.1 hypothetical protein E1B28_001247 [Marasmius oreades]